MSSTNRGGQRTESDNYPTPLWSTQRFLERAELPKGLWYEPCAGEGAIIQAATLHGLEGVHWQANELREDAAPILEKFVKGPTYEDCLDPDVGPKSPALIITNPPFSIAWEILHTSLRRWPKAQVALLLRLNFLGSVGRSAFMREYPPDIYVLPNRPDFKGNGKTDSIEYAWFHWPAIPRGRDAGKICILDDTPLEERRSSISLITYPE